MSLTRRGVGLSAVALGFAGPGTLAQPAPATVSADETRRILKERIDTQRQGVGLVAAVVTPRGVRTIGHGRLAKDDPRKPDGDTVFEIGSLTKVFTGLLFADMVLRGELGLEDPLAKHLPGVRLPERNGRGITLLDLATHTAGLPRFPTNPRLPPNAPKDVFEWYLATEGYTEADLFAFLAGFSLPRDPGARWDYSNVGSALLGIALCRRARLDYDALVARRITGPLAMSSTAVRATPAMARRTVGFHELDLRPCPRWEPGPLAPAGGLLSTANDLSRLLRAVMPGSRSPLAAANVLALRTRRPTPAAGYEQAVGWEIVPVAGERLPWKTGLTRGCTAAMVMDPTARTAVVVLANSDRAPSDIARHLIRPAAPLARSFVAVDVPPERLEAYVGRYQGGGALQLDVERLGRGLGVRFAGSPPAALTAISDTAFLTPGASGEFEFQRGPDGSVAAVVIKRAGQPPVTAARAP